jgi:predicted oxidoreductase (fatty acid repression mutant protein)
MEKIRAEWDIPESWRMTGQMPFGKIMAEPKAKDLRRNGELVKVFE